MQYWPDEGDFHPLRIGDPIKPMILVVRYYLIQGFGVKIFTARVGPKGSSPNNKGVKRADIHKAISDWTKEHVGTALEATATKDYNMVTLYDDRAIQVTHNEGRVVA